MIEGQIIQQRIVPEKDWQALNAKIDFLTELLKQRTFPKKLTPYTVKELAVRLKVHYKTIESWIHSDKILSKKGIESYKKAGHNYVIMVDDEELK